MNRIANEWKSFENSVLDPIRASRIQRREMKRAFYAGAGSLFALLVGATSDGDPDEVTEADMDLMNDISRELDQFAKAVKQGRA